MSWSGGFRNRFNRSGSHRTVFRTGSSLHHRNGIKFVENDFEKPVEKKKSVASSHVTESSPGTPSDRHPLKEINQVDSNRNEGSSKEQMEVSQPPQISKIPCGSSSSDSGNGLKEPNPNHASLRSEMGIHQGVPLVPYTPPVNTQPLNSQSSSPASSKGGNAASHHLAKMGFVSEKTSDFDSLMAPVMQRSLSTPFHHLKAHGHQPEPMDTSTSKADPTYFDSLHNLPSTSTPSATTAQNEVDDSALYRTPIQREQSPAFDGSLVVTPSTQRKRVRFASPAEDMENQFRSKRYLYTPLPKPDDQDVFSQDGNNETTISLSSQNSSSSLISSSDDVEIVGVFPAQSKDREQDESPPTLQTHHDALQQDTLPTPSKDQEDEISTTIQTQQAALQQDDDSTANTDDHSPGQSNRSSSGSARSSCPAHPSRNPAHFMFHRGHRSSYNHCRCRKVKVIRTVIRSERPIAGVRTIKVRDVGTQTSP